MYGNAMQKTYGPLNNNNNSRIVLLKQPLLGGHEKYDDKFS